MRGIFGWGAGLTHILHVQRFGNFSPSNTGLVVYWDILWPVVSAVLYWLYTRERRAGSSSEVCPVPSPRSSPAR